MSQSDDIFDLVDEHDCVIGRERRSIVHARHLRHRAVHILLVNGAGQVFLQRRSPLKDKNPDRWDSSCSGHVDSGEDYDTAAVRELHEELGVQWEVTALPRVLRIEACRETGNEFVWVYTGRHDGPFQLNPNEISGGCFWTRAEIDAQLQARPREFSGAFAFIWEQVKTKIGVA